jgi:hypothetical protein
MQQRLKARVLVATGGWLVVMAVAAQTTLRSGLDLARAEDSLERATVWRVTVEFAGQAASLYEKSQGQGMRVGEIDPCCVVETNELPELSPYERSAHTWVPGAATWAATKERSVEEPALVTITGFDGTDMSQPLSRGQVRIWTSADPVGAPLPAENARISSRPGSRPLSTLMVYPQHGPSHLQADLYDTRLRAAWLPPPELS